jgi:hypothetical protein
MPIRASNPVSVPGTSEVTFDQWYVSQLIMKANAERAFTVVHLNRSATVDGKTVLMDGPGSELSFTLDFFKEMGDTPEIKTAMDAILTAVLAYGTKKKLL